MKLGILAYPRSGSSLLYHVLKEHVDCYGCLGEVFNPTEVSLLLEKNEKLVLAHQGTELEQHEVQSRKYRLGLVEKYDHQDYFIKVLSLDTTVPEIVRYLYHNYKFITIERRNTFDSVLSGLIAKEYWYFNFFGREAIPDYKPFATTHADFGHIRASIRHYFNVKEKLFVNNIISSVVYEDIVDKSRGEILEMAGFPGIVDNEVLPLRKLLSFEEKCALITNLDEVAQWYQEELTFFIPEDR